MVYVCMTHLSLIFASPLMSTTDQNKYILHLKVPSTGQSVSYAMFASLHLPRSVLRAYVSDIMMSLLTARGLKNLYSKRETRK